MATNQRKRKANLVTAPALLRAAITAAVQTEGELPAAKRLRVARLTLARTAAGFLVCESTVLMLAAGIAKATTAAHGQLALPM